jgi:hypothetical protein
MDSHTRENCIKVLKQLRDVHQGQLDTSVIVDIEILIAALEDPRNIQPSSEWRWRTLKAIADVVTIVTNLTDLMRQL